MNHILRQEMATSELVKVLQSRVASWLRQRLGPTTIAEELEASLERLRRSSAAEPPAGPPKAG